MSFPYPECIPPELVTAIIENLDKKNVQSVFARYAPIISGLISFIIALLSYILNRESFIKQKEQEGFKDLFKEDIYLPVIMHVKQLSELASDCDALYYALDSDVAVGSKDIKFRFEGKSNSIQSIIEEGCQSGWFDETLFGDLQDNYIEKFSTCYDKIMNPENSDTKKREGLKESKDCILAYKNRIETQVKSTLIDIMKGKLGRRNIKFIIENCKK